MSQRRADLFFDLAAWCEEIGKPNLARLYLQRAIACERAAKGRQR